MRVIGLRELLTVTDAAGYATKKLVRDELRKAALPVKEEAQRLFTPYSELSASRYGISVRRVGTVTVEQRIRMTEGEERGRRWGALQMAKALYPAAESKETEVVSTLEAAVDRLADQFERR